MKKFFLIVFILVDLAVIGASAVFLMDYLKGTPSRIHIPGMTLPTTSTPATSGATGITTSTSTAQTPVPTAMGAPAASGGPVSRKIGFTYRNSHAKKVMIRADFTGWRAEPMEKGAPPGTWKYTAILEPGEYAYCYSVDDKSIRDPANKHTKLVGKTVVSSIVVQPPNTAPH